ncbi:hypothetical protein B0F90DRAFT_1814020 [Multifurca ochricompacta]|uniref:DUF676 domain-containing protein n=1 Tax=Multifurca ochricompacta TaxID=376703 RepID=A0AAD4MCR5_9AGAM|nr:hypothetical protein B0F90DRAFT_1814020 [Multifurca ochricompacta]
MPDLLLIIFIHGFKGDDSTFKDFPSRLQHILSETVQGTITESIVFPAYETKGDLNNAVQSFSDWLTTITVQKEVAHGGAGRARIVLCGHSMGGLLAADSIYEFVRTRPNENAPLWPNIIACLAFDTPYLGLHPHVFTNSATKVADYVQNVHKTTSGLWGAFNQPVQKPAAPAVQPVGLLPPSPVSRWGRWAPAALAAGGALIAGAAAGSAYYHRRDIESSYGTLMEHMQYVGALWDRDDLTTRVRHLAENEARHGVIFRMFYALLPSSLPTHLSSRTFCILPEPSSDVIRHFVPARNTLAEDEVRAHISMFDPGKNDGYYQLGFEAVAVIRQAITGDRTAAHDSIAESFVEIQVEPVDIGGEQRADTSMGDDNDLLL